MANERNRGQDRALIM